MNEDRVMKVYNEYKPYNDVWLSSIPSHWDERKIKYLFSERVDKGYPNEPLLAATQTKGVIPKSLYEIRTVTAEKDLHSLKLVNVGDFVISLRSFQGGIEYAYYRGIISPAYTIMNPSDNIDSGYFRHLAKSKVFIGLLNLCVTGIREGQNINYDLLNNSQIPLPPLEEQKQIVRYLDSKTAKINKLVQLKKKEVELLKEYRQALITKAVTKGIHEGVKMKDSGVEWIGEIPENWDIQPLQFYYKEHKIKNKGNRINNVLSLSYGRIVHRKVESNKGLLPKSFETYNIVESGNIVLRLTDLQNDKNSWRAGLVTQNGIITSAYITLESLNENISNEFYYYLMHVYDRTKVIYNMGNGIRQNLNFSELRKLPIVCPPYYLQKSIASYLDKKCSSIDKLISEKQSVIEKLSEYKTRLISDVVTGKIDVRDVINDVADDEQNLSICEDIDYENDGLGMEENID